MEMYEREDEFLMMLNEFLKQQKIKQKKKLYKQDILKSEDYEKTKYKEQFLANRLNAYEAKLLSEMANYTFSDEEYTEMIDLLRFVFPNIPHDRYTFRCHRLLTHDEMQMYEKIEECEKEKLISQIDEDAQKCERLLCYLLLMKRNVKQSEIQEDTEEQIKNLFHSFSSNPLQYISIEESEKNTNDMSVCNKRKTHNNKRELFDRLYERIFINRSDNAPDHEENSRLLPYINENEKEIVSFLLHVDPAQEDITFLTEQRIINQLIAQDQSEVDQIQKMENANAKLNRIIDMVLGEELLEDACSLYRYFEDEKEDIRSIWEWKNRGDRYWCEVNPDWLGKESVFEELNSMEIDFINYLYHLYNLCLKKGEEMKQVDNYDIRNPENSRKWDILNTEEREQLAGYIWQLYEDDQTIKKYTRKVDITEARENKYCLFSKNSDEDPDFEKDGDFEEQGFSLGEWRIANTDELDEAKEILLSLAADIGNHPYYETYKRAEQIFQFCKETLWLMDLGNPETKRLYSSLEDKLKKTDSVCKRLSKRLEKDRAFRLDDEE